MNRSALARKNLERRLGPVRALSLARPARGWVRAVREALGMTSAQLAERLGVVPSRVTSIEKSEAQDAVTLRTLREAAEAMDCMLVYALVPRRAMDDLLLSRAKRRADADLARVRHTMRLENQAPLEADSDAQRQARIAELLAGPPKRLWEEP